MVAIEYAADHHVARATDLNLTHVDRTAGSKSSRERRARSDLLAGDREFVACDYAARRM
jgi:hypothetical protein